MLVEMEVPSFKWVRRGNIAHAGLPEAGLSFCGVPLSKYKDYAITAGTLQWCDRCVAATHNRHAVPTK